MTMVNTKNILFICGGAFPELEEIIKERLNQEASIGFRAKLKVSMTRTRTCSPRLPWRMCVSSV